MTNLKVGRVEAHGHGCAHTPKWSVLQIYTRVLSNNSVLSFFLIYFWVRITALWYAETEYGDVDEYDGDDNIGCDSNSMFASFDNIYRALRSTNGAASRAEKAHNGFGVLRATATPQLTIKNHWLEVIFLYHNWNCFPNSLIRSQELCSAAFVLSTIRID